MLRFSAALVMKAIEPVSGCKNCCDSRAASALAQLSQFNPNQLSASTDWSIGESEVQKLGVGRRRRSVEMIVAPHLALYQQNDV